MRHSVSKDVVKDLDFKEGGGGWGWGWERSGVFYGDVTTKVLRCCICVECGSTNKSLKRVFDLNLINLIKYYRCYLKQSEIK